MCEPPVRWVTAGYVGCTIHSFICVGFIALYVGSGSGLAGDVSLLLLLSFKHCWVDAVGIMMNGALKGTGVCKS